MPTSDSTLPEGWPTLELTRWLRRDPPVTNLDQTQRAAEWAVTAYPALVAWMRQNERILDEHMILRELASILALAKEETRG